MHQHLEPERDARPPACSPRRRSRPGLTVKPHIKTSLAPGSRIVTEYLTKAGLLPYLEKLGFSLAAYGCTTCIGNAGDLTPEINEAITKNDLVCAAVLSGNRNFEARIHPNLKANFLASPPLVVAYAIAGTVLRDLMTEPVGKGKGGKDVYLGDIWPTSDEIARADEVRDERQGLSRRTTTRSRASPGKLWEKIQGVTGQVYNWPKSTYIAEPPFFEDFEMQPPRAAHAAIQRRARMALFGDSITTDHISPAGSIKETLAGRHLAEGATACTKADFNSLRLAPRQPRGDDARHLRQRAHQEPDDPAGRRRLARGRRRDAVPAVGGEKMFIYDAAMKYMAAGHADGRSSAARSTAPARARDWAAKGTQLLGIKAVVAQQLRAHPPLATWSAWACCRCSSSRRDSWESLGITRRRDRSTSRLGADAQAAAGRDARDPPRRRQAAPESP